MRVTIKITGDYTQWNQYGQSEMQPLSPSELEDMVARFAHNFKLKHGLGDCELVGEVDESDPHTIVVRVA